MSRYSYRPDSVLQSNGDFLATGKLNGFITGNVAAGELCTLFESACIKRTDPSLSWDLINSDGIEPHVVYEPVEVTNIVMTSMTVVKACGRPKRLGNGHYCVPMQTGSGIGFHLRGSSGLQITEFIQVTTDVSTTTPDCITLVNGSFVIVWVVSSTIKFCVCTSNGIVGSVVTVSTIVATSGLVPWQGNCSLVNGNFMLTWATTGGVLQGVVYTSAGTIVGTVFTIDATCAGVNISVVNCTNGDCALSCFDSAHNVYKAFRISNVGAIIWGAITPSGSGTAIFSQPDAARIHPPENRICELPQASGTNLNIAFVLNSSSGYAKVFVLHGDTGALVGIGDPGTSYRDTGNGAPIIATPFGFCLAHALNDGPDTYVSFFDSFGNCISQNVHCDDSGHLVPTNATGIVNFYLGYANSAIVITRYVTYGGNTEAVVIHIDHRGNRIGTPFRVLPWGPSDCNAPVPHCDVDGFTFICIFKTTVLQMVPCSVRVGRSSVIGYAQASATDGQACTFVANGYSKLPSSQIFGPGVAFDRRASTPLGARGVVGGQNAILFGWV